MTEIVRSPQSQVPRREDIISLQDFNVMEHNDIPHGSGSNKEKLDEMTISDTSTQLTSIYCPYNNDLPCFLTIESCHIGYLNDKSYSEVIRCRCQCVGHFVRVTRCQYDGTR